MTEEIDVDRIEISPEFLRAKELLNPIPSEPQTPFDSLLRDFLSRIVEKVGPISLDITDWVRPEILEGKPLGDLKWSFGAFTDDESLRDINDQQPVPFEKISRLEVTIWHEAP